MEVWVFSSEPTGDPGEGSGIGDSKETLRLEGSDSHSAPSPSPKSQLVSERVDFESVEFSYYEGGRTDRIKDAPVRAFTRALVRVCVELCSVAEPTETQTLASPG